MKNVSNLLQQLTAATPKDNVLKWAASTLFYATVILLNEQFQLLTAIGMTQKEEAIWRLIGVFLYILATLYHFQKTASGAGPLPDPGTAPRMSPRIRTKAAALPARVPIHPAGTKNAVSKARPVSKGIAKSSRQAA
jgi:hypothetical protein